MKINLITILNGFLLYKTDNIKTTIKKQHLTLKHA
jgi:hypothetical protein